MMASIAAVALLAGIALPAHGADPSVVEAEGATVRLVAAPDPEGDGLRGAILFDLDSGWKTYFADPGEAGLAPTIEIAGTHDAKFLYPLPVRFREGDLVANGYTEPVAIAFRLPAIPSEELEVRLFAGLCRELCVPLSADLRLDLAEPMEMRDATALERAFLALPTDDPSPLPARITDNYVSIARDDLADAADIFLSGPGGWQFGVAALEGNEWRIPIRSRPESASSHLPMLEAVLADSASGRRRIVAIHN